MLSNTLSVLAVGALFASATPLPKHRDGQQCLLAGRRGIYRNGLCIDADIDVDVEVHKRSLVSPFRLGHAYPDRTPCWVQGRRGWVKDQTCTDLIDIDASISVGKRHHSFDDPYFKDGTPCFHHGREGIVENLLCVDLDIDVGENYPDSDYFGPWRFSHPYSDGDACWVDSRRGWVHDGTCGNLLDLDTDILLSKRFYKDDPYYIDGVPCVKDGKEGVITDYICVVADVKIDARGYRHGLVNGERCWQRGRQGVVDGLLCVVADVSIGKRGIVGPHDGDACLHDGRWGRYHNDLCLDLDVDVDVDIKARHLLTGHGEGLVGGLVKGLGLGGNRYAPHQGRPAVDLSHYQEDGLVVDADALVDIKRDIKADADADVKVDFNHIHDHGRQGWRHDNVGGIKADVKVYRRGLRHDGHHHDVLDLDTDVKADVDVDVHRRSFRHHGHHHDILDVDADVKADVDVDLHRRALNHNEHDDLKLDASVKAQVDADVHRRALNHNDHDDLDLDLDVKADVDVHRRALNHNDLDVDVDVESKTDVDLKARGGDALLLGAVVSNSVKNLGKVVNNALEGKRKRDILGLGGNDELLDLDLKLDLDNTLHLTHDGHGHGGIIGGILRARSGNLMPRSLLNSLGLGRGRGKGKGKGWGKGLLGGAGKAKGTSASGGILGISKLAGGKAL